MPAKCGQPVSARAAASRFKVYESLRIAKGSSTLIQLTARGRVSDRSSREM